ncbi:AraC family transcriptional regulator [Paenibacillus polymyxa]|uniref:AraC family transcriptional regulator n=1 Tax=Paenibacillus polymyxa TaxID=1406 RepID=UPI0004DF00DD|nr:GyrI-like domain-containing protein [Paenibacillus polymyxa]RPE03343.1 DNA gyrase inhibitor [Paenibacillus polymyxa]
MKAEIEKIPSCRIAYMRQIGPYGIANSQLMEKFKCWVKSNNLFNNTSIILGIAQDNPAFVRPENCRYDACLVLPDDYYVNADEVSLSNISGGRHAVFKINHTAEAVQRTWTKIFLELESQRFSLDETRPILERYTVELINNHYCEICVPIQ